MDVSLNSNSTNTKAPRLRVQTTAARLDRLEEGQDRIFDALTVMGGKVEILNGHKPKLYRLADASDALVKLAEAAPELIATAKEREELDAFHRVRARRWGWLGRLDIARPWLYLGVALFSAGIEHWLSSAHLLGF